MAINVVDDGNFAIAQPHGPMRFAPAFEGDKNFYILEQDYVQNVADFSPLPLDTPHDTHLTYYLVEETAHQPVGCGVVKWTRVFAQVPNTRNDYQQFSARLPGLGPGGSNAKQLIVNNTVTNSGTPQVCNITTATAHGLTAGDNFLFYYTANVVNVYEQNYFVVRTAISASGTTITCAPIFPGAIPYCLWVVKSSIGRPPVTRTVNSKIVTDYFLPGITAGIATAEDIPILATTKIIGPGGIEVDGYNLDATTPAQTIYAGLVAAKTYVVIEDSANRRWKGNIIERITRYIVAQ